MRQSISIMSGVGLLWFPKVLQDSAVRFPWSLEDGADLWSLVTYGPDEQMATLPSRSCVRGERHGPLAMLGRLSKTAMAMAPRFCAHDLLASRSLVDKQPCYLTPREQGTSPHWLPRHPRGTESQVSTGHLLDTHFYGLSPSLPHFPPLQQCLPAPPPKSATRTQSWSQALLLGNPNQDEHLLFRSKDLADLHSHSLLYSLWCSHLTSEDTEALTAQPDYQAAPNRYTILPPSSLLPHHSAGSLAPMKKKRGGLLCQSPSSLHPEV